jgi:hypothetical protein
MSGCLLQASAQESFSRRYDTFGQLLAQTGWAIEFADTGYLAVQVSYYIDSPWLYILTAVSKIGLNGEILQVDQSPLEEYSTYSGWANSSDVTLDGRVVIGGGTYHPGDIQRPALVFFDITGAFDTIVIYDLIPEGWEGAEEWIGRQAKQTPDGGYVICGETSTSPGIAGFLLKVDSAYQLQWVQTYGGPPLRDYIISVDLAPNGGYYMGGQKEMSFQIFDPWVLHVDSLGEIIWEGTYGSPFNDLPNAHLTTMADGLPVFAGGLATSTLERFVPCLVKIGADGQVVWQQTYGEAIGNTTFFAVKEIDPGGDLIAVGQHYLSNLQVNSIRSGTLLRTTNEGDSLWMRFYQYNDSLVTNGPGAFRDVLPTPDGGFVAVGTASSGGTPYSQDLWVVKVDEHGCLEPGCHLITGLHTQVTHSTATLRVWPNPVARGGNLSVELSLPEHLQEGPLHLHLTSSDGRLVAEQVVPTGVLSFNFPVSNFNSGLYHLHLTQAGRWLAGAKVVVE